jgi:acyl-coenzyme A thioesterase PaaI-like protein
VPLVHHELCFGCGRVNLFGLLLEVQEVAPGTVAGRCFLKQDHQGPARRSAHDGVISAALLEAMSLLCDPGMRPREVRIEFAGEAPIGTFAALEARILTRGPGDTLTATATATGEHGPVASGRATYQLRPQPG